MKSGVTNDGQEARPPEALRAVAQPLMCTVMAKAQPTSSETVVRDSKSGRFVTVRGVGALKGHLTIKRDVDLTKPIASQALKKARKSKNGSAAPKR